jgi:hypothetical protein
MNPDHRQRSIAESTVSWELTFALLSLPIEIPRPMEMIYIFARRPDLEIERVGALSAPVKPCLAH